MDRERQTLFAVSATPPEPPVTLAFLATSSPAELFELTAVELEAVLLLAGLLVVALAAAFAELVAVSLPFFTVEVTGTFALRVCDKHKSDAIF